MNNDREIETGKYQRRGVPLWFIIVTAAVSLWGLYYVLRYWGGLGPGIGY